MSSIAQTLTPFIPSIRLVEQPLQTSSFGSPAHGQDFDEQVNQLESAIDAFSKNVPAAERAEWLRAWRGKITAMRATIAIMKAEGRNAHNIHIKINELVHEFETARHRFAEGNGRFEANKTIVLQQRAATSRKIEDLKSLAPQFGKFERPAEEKSPAEELKEIKARTVRSMQMADSEGALLGGMIALSASSKHLQKKEQQDLMQLAADARTGGDINRLAAIPALTAKIFSEAIDHTVVPIVKTFIEGAASEGFLDTTPQSAKFFTRGTESKEPTFHEHIAHVRTVRNALNGENPEVNQALQQAITPSMRSVAAALERVRKGAQQLDNAAQQNFLTTPSLVANGVQATFDIALNTTAIGIAVPVVRGAATAFRGTIRGLTTTAHGIKTGVAATSRTLRTVADNSRVFYNSAVLAVEKRAFAKATESMTAKPVAWSSAQPQKCMFGQATSAKAHLGTQNTLPSYGGVKYLTPKMDFIETLPQGRDRVFHFLKSYGKDESPLPHSLFFSESPSTNIRYGIQDFAAGDQPYGGLMYALQGHQLVGDLKLKLLKAPTLIKGGTYQFGSEIRGLLAIADIEGIGIASLFAEVSTLPRDVFLENLKVFAKNLGKGVGEFHQVSRFPIAPTAHYLDTEVKEVLSLFKTIEQHFKKQNIPFICREKDVLKISTEFVQNPGPASLVLDAEFLDFIWNPVTQELFTINPGKIVKSATAQRQPTGVPVRDYLKLKAQLEQHSTKAGLNAEEISMLQSTFEQGYRSEFSFNPYTPEAIKFYELREGLLSLKMSSKAANPISKAEALIANFLRDESGSGPSPFPINFLSSKKKKEGHADLAAAAENPIQSDAPKAFSAEVSDKALAPQLNDLMTPVPGSEIILPKPIRKALSLEPTSTKQAGQQTALRDQEITQRTAQALARESRRGIDGQITLKRRIFSEAKQEMLLLKQVPEIVTPAQFPKNASQFWARSKIKEQNLGGYIYNIMKKDVLYFLESPRKPGSKSVASVLDHAKRKNFERTFIAWDPTVQPVVKSLQDQGKEIVGFSLLSRGEGINPLYVVEIK